MKRFIIWIISMIVMAFLVNTAGTLVTKYAAGNMFIAAMAGYSKKGENMLHPTLKEPDEKNKTNGLSALVIRSMIDNDRIVNKISFWHNFLFTYIDIDQSVIMFEKDGMSQFSKGTFVYAYENKNEQEGDSTIGHMRYTTGLIDVRDFCEQDCAEEVYKLLENNPNALMKVDSYSISDFLIKPASITILDRNDNILGTFNCKCDGEIITADNIYIQNNNKEINDESYFGNKMKVVELGERRADKIAEKLMDKIDFSDDNSYNLESGYGFGHYIAKSYEVTGDYAMVTVLDLNFTIDVLLYIAIFGVIITILVFTIGRKKKNEYY